MLTREELDLHAADPAIADWLATGNIVAVAARLSELLTEVVPVPLKLLAAWAAPSIRAKLQDHASNITSPLRSIALSALDMMQGAFSSEFDTVAYAGMLDALQAGAIVTATERAQLAAIAMKPKHVRPEEVAVLVRNDDGSAK